MIVRKASYEDIPRLMEIYSSARQIMRNSGNLHQWDNSYPSEDIIKKDISEGYCNVLCRPESGYIIAAMAFIPGPDPTYEKIYDDISMTAECSWPDDEPYHVIHRIAVEEPGHGAFGQLMEWAFRRLSDSGCSPVIRIDTHADNVIMHHLMDKNGFKRCGVIRLASGDPRIAYIKKSQTY